MLQLPLRDKYAEPDSSWILLHITGNLQAVSSDTGNLLDDFTLVKPANYTPNYKGRAHLAVSFTLCPPQ